MFKKPQLDLFEKVVLRKTKGPVEIIAENLQEMNVKSSEGIQKVLEERQGVGEGFTLAGKSLVHLECQGTRANLQIKYVEEVYKELVKTKTNQAISLQGNSLKAKELSKTLILSHLDRISSGNQQYFKYIQSAVDLLTIFGSDGDNTYYGEVIELQLSEKFIISGCRIKAKLADLDVSQFCGIYRILLSLSDPAIQHLGLFQHILTEKNLELHQNFKKNLDILGISWSESQEIMEILSVTVLISDINLVTPQYIKAGQREENIYSPELSKNCNKICKLLGILQSRFLEFFTGNKKIVQEKFECLKKFLVALCFEYFVEKINECLHRKANEVLGAGRGVFKISILQFPSPKIKSNIEGILSNLLVECQEFASYESFLSILSLFHEEKVSASRLSVPRCRYVIELFLDKSFGIMYNFCNTNYWDKLKAEVNSDAVYNKVLSVNENLITLNNTWGSNLYFLPTLQHQILQFPDSQYQSFLKRSSNRLISSSLQTFTTFTYQDYTLSAISYLLYEVSQHSIHQVLCYKEAKDLISETSVVSLMNIPYQYMIAKATASLSDLKKLGYNVAVTDHFYLLEKGSDDSLKKIIGRKWKLNNCCGIKILGDVKVGGPTLSDFVTQIKNTGKERKRSSSARPRPAYVPVTISSRLSTGSFTGSLKNFKNYNYSELLPKIVLIQSAWRLYKSKKYLKVLKLLHHSANVIQKCWRGRKIRKQFNLKKIISALVFIQRKFKQRFRQKVSAARVIQRYIIHKKIQLLFKQETLAMSRKESEKMHNTDRRWKEKIQRAESAKKLHTFAPILSKKTLEIAKNVRARESLKLKIEDKLLLQEKKRQEKLELAIFKKKSSETVHPIKSERKPNNNFYEEELKFLQRRKEDLRDIKDHLQQDETAKCPFKPELHTSASRSRNSRTPMQAVQDLMTWDQRRIINREKLSEKNNFETQLKMTKSRPLVTSSKLHKNKLQTDSEKNRLAVTVKRNISPYWPIK